MQAAFNDATIPIGKDIYSADALRQYLEYYRYVLDGIDTPLNFNADFIDSLINGCTQTTWSYEFICYTVAFISSKLFSQTLKEAC